MKKAQTMTTSPLARETRWAPDSIQTICGMTQRLCFQNQLQPYASYRSIPKENLGRQIEAASGILLTRLR
jgi:hypothetical protein